MLKTLKDFKHPTYGNLLVVTKDLKQEAIKWVKELDKKNKKGYSDSEFVSYHDFDDFSDTRNVIKWIKHFFNIKEEDLNSGGI